MISRTHFGTIIIIHKFHQKKSVSINFVSEDLTRGYINTLYIVYVIFALIIRYLVNEIQCDASNSRTHGETNHACGLQRSVSILVCIILTLLPVLHGSQRPHSAACTHFIQFSIHTQYVNYGNMYILRGKGRGERSLFQKS